MPIDYSDKSDTRLSFTLTNVLIISFKGPFIYDVSIFLWLFLKALASLGQGMSLSQSVSQPVTQSGML